MYTWTVADDDPPDWAGAGFPGPGDPEDVAVASPPELRPEGLPAPGDAGNVLTSTGSAWVSLAPSVASRLTPLDANHIHAWELTEASGDFADTGSSGTLASLVATTGGNAPLYSTEGLLGHCPFFGMNAQGSSSETCRASVLTSALPDLPLQSLTMEIWYRAIAPRMGGMMGASRTGAGNFFLSDLGADNTLAIIANYSGSGLASTTVNAIYRMATPYIWHHLATTYDGANNILWIDGEPILNVVRAGDIKWFLGTGPALAIAKDFTDLTQFFGQLSRFRISNIVRSQSYLRAVTKKALYP